VLKETFKCVAKKSDNYLIQCASHTQHALSRGSGGMPPKGFFCKFGLLSLNFVIILSEKIHDATLFIIPLQFVNIATVGVKTKLT